MKRYPTVSAALVVCALTACGGGEQDESETASIGFVQPRTTETTHTRTQTRSEHHAGHPLSPLQFANQARQAPIVG